MKLKKSKSLLAALAVVSVLSLTACGSDKPAETQTSNMFSTMDTTDLNGSKFTSEDFSQNKLTLVNIWNTGCTPCVQELPILDQLNKEYAEQGVAIKGLYFDLNPKLTEDTRKEIDAVLSDSQVEYQQLLFSDAMRNSDIFQNLDAIPVTYLIDSEGNIVDTIHGSSDYDGWKEIIEDGLKKVNEDA